MRPLLFFNIAVCFFKHLCLNSGWFISHILSLLRKIYILNIFAAMLVLCGCVGPVEPLSTFEHPYYKHGKNTIEPLEAYALRRAAEIKKTAVGRSGMFGCVLNDETMSCYVSNAPALTERCLDFGFSDIFLQSNWNDVRDEKRTFMENFVADALKHKLRVWMILETEPLHGRYQKTAYIDPRYLPGVFDFDKFFAEAEWVCDFSDELKSKGCGALSGVALRVSPSSITLLNRRYSDNSLFAWSDRKYGYGNDNDTLMKKSFSLLGKLKHLFKDLPLLVITENFYHEAVSGKLLSCGSINDFLVYGRSVALLCPKEKPSQIFRVCKNELMQAGRKRSVIVMVDVLYDVYREGDDDFAGDKRWKKFMKDLQLLYHLRKYPAFEGVIINDFEGMESYLRRARN